MSLDVQVLLATFIATNLFWAIQVHRLVNKLMSRNFAEYNTAINPQPEITRVAPDHLSEPDALSELNALIPS